MPSIEKIGRHQTALLWPATGAFDEHGQPVVGAFEEISVRWESTHREARDAKGNTITIEADVFVPCRVDVHSMMWLGDEDSWYGAVGSGSAGNMNGLMSVVSYEEIPDAKGRHAIRVVGLARWRDSLPELS